MGAERNIASAAVVLVASSDKMVAGLDHAKAKVDKFGAQTQASLRATSNSVAAQMSEMWEKSNRFSNAMKAGNWGNVVSRSGDWKDAAKSWGEGAQAAQGSMTSRMAAMWSQWESQKSKLAGSMASAWAKMDPLHSLNPGLPRYVAGLNAAYKATEAWADKTQKMISTKGVDFGGKGGSGSGGKGVLKGLKLGEVAEMGLTGAFVALGIAVTNAFSTHYVEKFNVAMERSRQIAEDLAKAVDKGAESRLRNNETFGIDPEALDKQIDSARKSMHGAERNLSSARDEQQKLLDSMSRSIAKGTMGWLGPIGDRFKTEEEEAKKKIDDQDAALKRSQKQLEALEKQRAAIYGKPWFVFNGDVLAAIGQTAITAGKQIAEGTEASIQSLKRLHDTIGMTAGDTAVYEAQDRGEKNPNKLAEIRLRAEAADRKKLTAGIDEQLKAMQREAAVYGMTEEKAKRYDLAVQGATATQLARYDLIVKEMEALQKASAMPTFRLASAIEAGSQEAIDIDLRAKGFDFQDTRELQKDTNVKLDNIRREWGKKLDELKDEMKLVNRKLEGGV